MHRCCLTAHCGFCAWPPCCSSLTRLRSSSSTSPNWASTPYAIAQLAELLEAATQRCQIIVSTQSVTLLDRVAVEDVVVAERVKGATRLSRLDVSELGDWLEDYSVGDLWLQNLIGARPHRP